MSVTVGLEAYRLKAAHGAFDWEHEKEQTFVVSIWATLKDEVRGKNLEATVDYGTLQEWIDEAFFNMPAAYLLEELAARLVDMAADDSRISSLKVRIEKPDAPLPHSGGLAVVEKLWQR
ncbi:MAG: dihydroneopterin aldolase [Candidatus Poseidoniaceae archaeon]|jgi:dihydroneopterin aldolase|nr:dihydroneopterin aldolase [Candidatus Poseidoniaceae archaeon]MDP7202998.1 dihydroneopterin aldolase [Candidatus Poseidoniaceae archaeon]